MKKVCLSTKLVELFMSFNKLMQTAKEFYEMAILKEIVFLKINNIRFRWVQIRIESYCFLLNQGLLSYVDLQIFFLSTIFYTYC